MLNIFISGIESVLKRCRNLRYWEMEIGFEARLDELIRKEDYPNFIIEYHVIDIARFGPHYQPYHYVTFRRKLACHYYKPKRHVK